MGWSVMRRILFPGVKLRRVNGLVLKSAEGPEFNTKPGRETLIVPFG
jgi:hypothetical protein